MYSTISKYKQIKTIYSYNKNNHKLNKYVSIKQRSEM